VRPMSHPTRAAQLALCQIDAEPHAERCRIVRHEHSGDGVLIIANRFHVGRPLSLRCFTRSISEIMRLRILSKNGSVRGFSLTLEAFAGRIAGGADWSSNDVKSTVVGDFSISGSRVSTGLHPSQRMVRN
jgi:hypothetical protein